MIVDEIVQFLKKKLKIGLGPVDGNPFALNIVLSDRKRTV